MEPHSSGGDKPPTSNHISKVMRAGAECREEGSGSERPGGKAGEVALDGIVRKGVW